MYSDGTPLDPTTSHLSLQNAYLTPSPLSTPARNLAAHTPVVTCVHAVHVPDGDQFVMSAFDVRGTKALQELADAPLV